ncbi:MAG: Protein translocase subunit SecE [Holosporales bacterium]
MKLNFITDAFRFFNEVKTEGKKVAWPTRRETIMTAISVFVLAMVAALFFVCVDYVIHAILKYFHVVG